jgi:hypothetical protein
MADNETTDDAKKSRHRSPNYPAVGLREAMVRVEALYDADKKAGAPIDSALKHMGFTSRHGKAMAVLSALKKFGLVEDVGGRIIPTKRAIEIIVLSEDDPRRLTALREAALGPDIYRELVDQFKDSGMPSDQSLMAELEAYKGFNPNAVEEFVADFRDSLNFAGLTKEGELSSVVEDDLSPMTETRSTPTAKVPAPAGTMIFTPPPSASKTYTWPLSGNAYANLQIQGGHEVEDLELIKEYLDLAIKAMKRKRQPD